MVMLARHMLCILAGLWLAASADAQTREVDPDDLRLSVTVETLPATPFRQEMILLNIHGIYKRHITIEKLQQPDLKGFNWMQLGEDHWYDSMLDGAPVKNMRRRMAVFPDAVGKLTIGGFKHQLTLLDEQNKWFQHTIQSDPVGIEVLAEPETTTWWFPVRRLEISDNWSNAPDQLAEGAGVLRVIRVSALGASPDMIPPMPELHSPSALIFAHPEKRLVNLTPRGPEAIAFWRWTVTPTNGHAAILEPIEFSYFDTAQRRMRDVVISAQRVAFLDSRAPILSGRDLVGPANASLSPILLAALGLAAFALALHLSLRGRAYSARPVRRWLLRRALRWRLWRAARRDDAATLRRAAHALDSLYFASRSRTSLLAQLEDALFARSPSGLQPRAFCRDFLHSLDTPIMPDDDENGFQVR